MCININDNSDQQNGCVLILTIIVIRCMGININNNSDQ